MTAYIQRIKTPEGNVIFLKNSWPKFYMATKSKKNKWAEIKEDEWEEISCDQHMKISVICNIDYGE